MSDRVRRLSLLSFQLLGMYQTAVEFNLAEK